MKPQKSQCLRATTGVIAAITMRLENARLTIDDGVAYLVKTGNFATFFPGIRGKNIIKPLSREERA